VPQQCVQSSHACIDACKSFDFASLSEHPSVIMCGVKTETQLETVCKRLKEQGIRFASFREPDIGHQLTSVCTQPIFGTDRDFFRKFQLLKEDTSKVFAVYYNNGCDGGSTHFVRANDSKTAVAHVKEHCGDAVGRFWATLVCSKIGDVA
jgi:hypothetical protein